MDVLQVREKSVSLSHIVFGTRAPPILHFQVVSMVVLTIDTVTYSPASFQINKRSTSESYWVYFIIMHAVPSEPGLSKVVLHSQY